MAPQKKNNVLMSLIAIGVTAMITFQSWIVSSIIVIREDLATIKSEMKAGDRNYTDDHATISMLHGRVQEGEQRNSNHEVRIANLEAMLPEQLRRKPIKF